MARELRVTVWCDQCRKVRRQVPGRTVEVSIGGVVVGELDLCDKHVASVTLAIKRALPRRPPRRRDKRDKKGPFLCQVTGCKNAVPLKHEKSLWQHLRLFHELTLAEYREQYGELTPMTAEELAAAVLEVRCDEAGCDQAYSTATGTRWPRAALVSHLRGRHGLKLTRDGQKVPIA